MPGARAGAHRRPRSIRPRSMPHRPCSSLRRVAGSPARLSEIVVKIIAAGLMLLSLVALAFGWWGMRTQAGRRTFDEMAGMVPLFSVMAGVILLIIGVICLLVAVR